MIVVKPVIEVTCERNTMEEVRTGPGKVVHDAKRVRLVCYMLGGSYICNQVESAALLLLDHVFI